MQNPEIVVCNQCQRHAHFCIPGSLRTAEFDSITQGLRMIDTLVLHDWIVDPDALRAQVRELPGFPE